MFPLLDNIKHLKNYQTSLILSNHGKKKNRKTLGSVHMFTHQKGPHANDVPLGFIYQMGIAHRDQHYTFFILCRQIPFCLHQDMEVVEVYDI